MIKLCRLPKQSSKKTAKVIPGGVVSVNRAVAPEIAFVRGQGSHVWDADGNEYIDYHAAFAPFILGHNDPDVNAAVAKILADGATLMGSGTNPLGGSLHRINCKTRTFRRKGHAHQYGIGSHLSRHPHCAGRTRGRNGVIVMQGGYNGWHNDVALNVMTPIDAIGPRVSPGEYKKIPLSAGVAQ